VLKRKKEMSIEDGCHMERQISFLGKQWGQRNIVQDSKTRRQHAGFKNNERTEGTGSILAHENYGLPSYGGLQDVFSQNYSLWYKKSQSIAHHKKNYNPLSEWREKVMAARYDRQLSGLL
jgi:hypothetical protein